MSETSFHLLLARRILKDKGNRFSRPIINLSVMGVSIGLIIMMIAIGITSGYKREIKSMVTAMGSHVRITHFDQNYSYELVPFSKDQPCLKELRKNPEIAGMQNFATKVGIVKTADQVEGIVLKGVDGSFDWRLFSRYILKGKGLELNNDETDNHIVISKRMADKLQLKVGDKVRTYFVQDPPRSRSFKVSGVYATGLPEYDNRYALVDLRHVQKLNEWSAQQVSGIEILLRDESKVEEMGNYIHRHISQDLQAETMPQIYPDIFDWIALFDTNVAVLLIITTCVCLVTMMSIFFIVILEQTQTIGILKTLGMKTKGVVKTFVAVAANILLKGMLIGDAIALTFGLLQQKFHLIKLNPDTYYVDFIPVHFNIWAVLLLNVAVFVICMVVLLLPAYVVGKKISPVQAVKWD